MGKENAQARLKDARTFRRLHTPSLNPQDWYLGGAVDGRFKDYQYGEIEGRQMIVAQNMSVLQIKRQEKMHNINLLNEG